MTLTMIDLRHKKGTHISHFCRLGARFGSFLLLASLAACASIPFPAFDLSPEYKAPEFVVPDSWEGTSDFVKANPSDDALRPDWWRLYNDPILNSLVEQAIAANPDLQATAERFVQARNSMMKARSRYFPQIGFGFGGNNNRQSDHSLFRAPGEPNSDTQVDPFFCYYINGKSYPYASRDEALGQVNFLKPRFSDYTSYANATIENIFTPEELKDTVVLKANELHTRWFENKGNYFEKRELPMEAQWTPVYSMVSEDVNQDGWQDLIMGGNESYVRVRLGRNNSSRGIVLINQRAGSFKFLPNKKSGLMLTGDVREIKTLKSQGRTVLLVGSVGEIIQSYVIKTRPL